jgi:hypothetical protein
MKKKYKKKDMKCGGKEVRNGEMKQTNIETNENMYCLARELYIYANECRS